MEYSISQYNSGVVQYIPVHSKGMVHRKGMVDVKGMVVRWVEKTDYLKIILAISFFNVGKVYKCGKIMKILNFILSLLVKGNLNIEIFPYGGWKKIL